MNIFRSRTAASLAALAALTMTVSPAFARGPGGWVGPRHHHYRGGGISGGDLLAGVLVIGGIAAIATAASKNSRNTGTDNPRYDYPGAPTSDAPRYDDQNYGDNGGDNGYADPNYGDQGYANERYDASESNSNYGVNNGDGQANFGRAVDACSSELERSNRYVDQVNGVQRMGDRYSVDGRLQDGQAYACSVDDTGQIRSVAVNGSAVY